MRSGILTSSLMHASLVAVGLVSIGAPEPLEAVEVESVEIELVPISEVATAVQGAQNAPLVGDPTPEQTQTEPVSEIATNVGDAKDDTKSVKADKEAFTANQETAPPKVEPDPKPAPKIADKADPSESQQPAAATEVAEAAKEEVQPTEQAASLPKVTDAPKPRPEPPKVQKAATPERKKPETETANNTTTPKQTSNTQADEVAALVNREESRKGGAKRETGQASLGTKSKTTGEKLTRGEHAALRSHYEDCFNLSLLENFAGVEEVTVIVQVKYNEAGQQVGLPKAKSSGGSKAAQSHARNSIKRDIAGCKSPPLPSKDKFSTWSTVILNFSLSEILNAGF